METIKMVVVDSFDAPVCPNSILDDDEDEHKMCVASATTFLKGACTSFVYIVYQCEYCGATVIVRVSA